MAKPVPTPCRAPPPLWKDCLSEEVIALPRTMDCFNKIEADQHLDYALPPPKALPGMVLRHVYKFVDRLIQREWPLIYKLGYTHCPYSRWWNRKYGYVLEKCQWQRMTVIYCGADTTSAAYIEAALIQRYKGILANDWLKCRVTFHI